MMVYALAVIGLCNILLIICLSRRIEDIGMRIKTNGALIDDVRDKVKYLTSLMDIKVNIPDEIEKQFGKMKKEIVIKKCIESSMTKEELRERILELEDRMLKEDSGKAISEMNDEWEELSDNLENVLYEELEGMALKVITEKIIERYDIDTDILVSEYMESGNLEKAFTAAAEECDCGWKEDIKKEIIKR